MYGLVRQSLGEGEGFDLREFPWPVAAKTTWPVTESNSGHGNAEDLPDSNFIGKMWMKVSSSKCLGTTGWANQRHRARGVAMTKTPFDGVQTCRAFRIILQPIESGTFRIRLLNPVSTLNDAVCLTYQTTKAIMDHCEVRNPTQPNLI